MYSLQHDIQRLVTGHGSARKRNIFDILQYISYTAKNAIAANIVGNTEKG